MGTDANTPTDEPSSTPPDTQGTEIGVRPDISALIEQLKKLLEKLDVPKRKDTWDILSVLTAFLGTVVVSAVSLYLTQSFQRLEAQRTRDFQAQETARAAQFQQAQIESQRAQIRVEELKAITALAPLLASSDTATRETGRQLLQAVRDTSTREVETVARDVSAPDTRHKPAPTPSLLDQFARIALSSTTSSHERVTATRRIGEIATAPSTAPTERERAANIAAQIVTSKETPPEVKQAASQVIAKIKRVSLVEVEQLISTQPIKRDITEVILHHTASPADKFEGTDSILSLAQFQLTGLRWSRVSWHYALAPDGSIWLGAPLDEKAIHASHHNDTSVSVLLIMDGDKELPTDAQRKSLTVVLRSLFTRLTIKDPANSPEGRGFHFHRDYDERKSCPGSLLTKKAILGWL
jgi:hypothetical protein